MDTEYNKLDDNWITKFEDTDILYKEYYKDDLYYVNLKVIYINRNNEIDKIKQESLLMTQPNKILHEEIIEILKKTSIDNDKRYTLISILKYNINLEPDDIKRYLQKNDDNLSFLSIIKHIDSITFEKSISMFHDLNDLILVLYEKSNELKKNDNASTKKIYLHSSHKKTIKKRYKE